MYDTIDMHEVHKQSRGCGTPGLAYVQRKLGYIWFISSATSITLRGR